MILAARCRGTTQDTRGTAFVVYEDIFDAKNACDHLSGFNVCNRYLVVLYYQPNKVGDTCLTHSHLRLSLSHYIYYLSVNNYVLDKEPHITYLLSKTAILGT